VATVASTILFSILIFAWYWVDSRSRSFYRSSFLNVGVIAIAIVAVPYYLARNRTRGERLKAFANLGCFLVLLVLALMVGSIAGAIFS
jgi:hypothetical protein